MSWLGELALIMSEVRGEFVLFIEASKHIEGWWHSPTYVDWRRGEHIHQRVLGHSPPMYKLFCAIYWFRQQKGLSLFNITLVTPVKETSIGGPVVAFRWHAHYKHGSVGPVAVITSWISDMLLIKLFLSRYLKKMGLFLYLVTYNQHRSNL